MRQSVGNHGIVVPDNFRSWKVNALKEYLRKRGLSVTGDKEFSVCRIVCPINIAFSARIGPEPGQHWPVAIPTAAHNCPNSGTYGNVYRVTYREFSARALSTRTDLQAKVSLLKHNENP